MCIQIEQGVVDIGHGIATVNSYVDVFVNAVFSSDWLFRVAECENVALVYLFSLPFLYPRSLTTLL